MMKKFLIASFAFFLAACTQAPPTPPIQNQNTKPTVADVNVDDGNETSSAEKTDDRLSNSPRHQEWVEVKNGEKTIYTWVVYPESSEKKPVVILIHENKGLNDWARGMADQVAEAGYIAVAPDLLSEVSTTEKRTSDFKTEDAATKALSALKPEEVMSDLQAVADWAKTIPATDGKLVSAGFCWGGARSFEFAAASDDLELAMVFYGTGPTDPAAYEKISVPVYGFYGGADARVNATIPQSEQYMTSAGKEYDYITYEGAGHAFMRSGEDPNGEAANIEARNAAWERMKEILGTL
jgi:carboxymethylenebutenolidase